MRDQGEITSDDAFERAGVPALVVAAAIGGLVVWQVWGSAIWLTCLAGLAAFGISFGSALAIFSDPQRFFRRLIGGTIFAAVNLVIVTPLAWLGTGSLAAGFGIAVFLAVLAFLLTLIFGKGLTDRSAEWFGGMYF